MLNSLFALWLAFPSLLIDALDTRALIEQALDEPTRIVLENARLDDAIARLTEQTGVRVVMSPDVMALVPYGASTTIQRVEIAHIPLREGLAQLFDPLGMTFEVRGDHVAVIPKPAILCLGRTPSWDEVDLLARLGSLQPGTTPAALDELKPLVQFQINAPDPWAQLSQAIRTVGAGPADQVLTVACANLGWAWCLSQDRVAITSIEQQTRRMLQQTITTRIANQSLFDVLNEISLGVHVPIRLESGAPIPRSYSIDVSNAPAERVLDKIAAETGLAYLIESGGVVFYSVSEARSSHAPAVRPASFATPASGNPSDPWFCKIVVQIENGQSVEFPLRESEVPSDIREFRERAKNRVFEMIREERDAGSP
jgi:hypothetical protein